jgi:hypothetical protein
MNKKIREQAFLKQNNSAERAWGVWERKTQCVGNGSGIFSGFVSLYFIY